jgi:hypothetical protein
VIDAIAGADIDEGREAIVAMPVCLSPASKADVFGRADASASRPDSSATAKGRPTETMRGGCVCDTTASGGERYAGGQHVTVTSTHRSEWLRRDKAGADDLTAIAQEIEMDEARLLFEHHAIADRPAEGRALAAKHEGGADIGMTGERDFSRSA